MNTFHNISLLTQIKYLKLFYLCIQQYRLSAFLIQKSKLPDFNFWKKNKSNQIYLEQYSQKI